jgi:hypothetical protein
MKSAKPGLNKVHEFVDKTKPQKIFREWREYMLILIYL